MSTSSPTLSTYSTTQRSRVSHNKPRLMTDNPTSLYKCTQTYAAPTPTDLLSLDLDVSQGKDCSSREVGGDKGNVGKTMSGSSEPTDEPISPPSTITSPTRTTSLVTAVPPAPTYMYLSTTFVHTLTSSYPSTTSIPASQPSPPTWSPQTAMIAAVSGALGLTALVSLVVLCSRSWYRRAYCWPAFCHQRGGDVQEQNMEIDQEMNSQLQNNSSTTSLTTLLGSQSHHRNHSSNQSQGQLQGTGGMVSRSSKVTGRSAVTIEILGDGGNERYCGSRSHGTEHDHQSGVNQWSCEPRVHEPQRCQQQQSQASSFKSQSHCLNGQTSFDLKPWHLGCALGVNAPLVVVHDPDGRCVDTLGHNKTSPSFTPRQQDNLAVPTLDKPVGALERSRWSLLQRFPSPPPKVKKNQACYKKHSIIAEGSRTLKGAQSIRRICLAAYQLDTRVQYSIQGNGTFPLSKNHYQQQQHRQQYQQRYRQRGYHEVVQYNQSKSLTKSIKIIKQPPLTLQQYHKGIGGNDGKEHVDLPIIVIVTDELKYPAKIESPTLPSAPQVQSFLP
ncbi:MAG: hypothetical protein J3Q66DRAFT_441090 [Benniella sp.]|nr:MAG: hypothetical protein J3Q66DRAFT_441090 [Benniella sp.]